MSTTFKDLDDTVKTASESARSCSPQRSLTFRSRAIGDAGLPLPASTDAQPRPADRFQPITELLQSGSSRRSCCRASPARARPKSTCSAIEATLAAGRSALLLVPEIALTPAMAGQFHHRFGDRVAILHSAFHDAERAEQWRRIRSGRRVWSLERARVSSRQFKILDLLIVDEEHDGSYKQHETPRYNGRDVAVMRARQANATVVLGSATPSLESRYNVERGKYQLLTLPERVEKTTPCRKSRSSTCGPSFRKRTSNPRSRDALTRGNRGVACKRRNKSSFSTIAVDFPVFVHAARAGSACNASTAP